MKNKNTSRIDEMIRHFHDEVEQLSHHQKEDGAAAGDGLAWQIHEEEKEICKRCQTKALEAGATAIRVTLNKCLMNELMVLNGYLDKVSQSGDRALTLNVFADGKYGTFSTNRLDWTELEPFIVRSIDTVRMLAPDECRQLPDPSRTIKGAAEGNELGLFDKTYGGMTPEKRLSLALGLSRFEALEAAAGKSPEETSPAPHYLEKYGKRFSMISEEIVWCDSIYNNYLIDSNGLECMQTETAFEASMEMTIQDEEGNKFTGYGWDAHTHFEGLDASHIAEDALKRAVDQIHPVAMESGKYNMVVENEVGGKLLGPILAALNGFSLQQQNSFLMDSEGKQLFSEGFSLADASTEYGRNGARLFDSEGVAYPDTPIIEKGKVCRYFINTYIAGKMGLAPTAEDAARPQILPYLPTQNSDRAVMTDQVSLQDILTYCQQGIFVTGFNGGNCNPSTGDFSYGVEGFKIEDGKIGEPVRGMVITGNMITLWDHLLAAGSDYRPCMNKQIPTLAFSEVDFSA